MSVTIDHENQTVSLSLTLTQEEFDGLIMLMGMAMGTATKEGMSKLSYACLRLANKINEGNPRWTPHWTPPDEKI
jgi:hypothetical protein